MIDFGSAIMARMKDWGIRLPRITVEFRDLSIKVEAFIGQKAGTETVGREVMNQLQVGWLRSSCSHGSPSPPPTLYWAVHQLPGCCCA